MPNYNYQCQDCQAEFEVQATLKEKEEKSDKKFHCPKCQSQKISQQFSAANFVKNIFKDDGGKGAGGCCSSGGCQCG
ncbi:MAG: FmdB family zinc ribbon protein [Patescibacteria group bacterium]|jgi:putative FmdB family regulatory protein